MSTASTPFDQFVEMEDGRKGFQPRPSHILYAGVFLGLFTAAFGYAVFHTGGVEFSDWNISLLILGIAAILYLLATRSLPPASSLAPWLAWPVLFFPTYIALQLIPLPLWLLGMLSPERAALTDSLSKLIGTSGFAPLSIHPAVTYGFLLTTVAYTVTFLLIREVTSRLMYSRTWAPAIPLILISAIEAAIGLLQAAEGGDVQGTYGSFDHFAGFLEMALPFAVAYSILLIRSEGVLTSFRFLNALKACAAFLAVVLILLAVLYSTSRMGVVASFSGLLAMGAFAMHTREAKVWKKITGVTCLVVIVVLVVTYFSPDTLITRFGELLADKESRWPIWRDTLHVIAAFPFFGCGLGNYGTAILRYQTTDLQADYNYAHNDFLQFASELGLVGFLILTSLILAICCAAVRATNRATDRPTRYLGLACLGGLVAIGLHSLTDFNMYIPANALVLVWISGISTGLPSGSQHDASHRFLTRVLLRRITFALACFLLAYASAWSVFEAAFKSDVSAERMFCRFGICDTNAVLAAETLKHGGTIAAVPKSELARALQRDSAAPLRWCDLGDALLKTGNFGQARYCFSNALKLAPYTPPVLMRAANFYYALHENKTALRQTALILKKTDAEDETVFDWYNEKKISATEILQYGLPAGPRAPQAYLRYLMNLEDTNSIGAVWNWIFSQGEADEPTAIQYTNYMFREQKYETAAQSWADYLGPARNGYLQSDWIYDGDFEREPSASVLDWNIEQVSGVAVTRDTRIFHSGGHSLRIQFDGKQNLTYNHVSETIFVRPGNYKFQAYVRCQDINSDQGVGFHIFDPETATSVDLKTDQFDGTTDWTKIEQVIPVPPNTTLLKVQITREPSWRLFDNKTTGTVWIDDVKLVRLD